MKRALTIVLLALALITVGCSSSTTTTAATDNSQTCQPLPNGNGPFVYVALGASDAVGIGADCAVTHGYVPLLGQKMPRGANVINLGISGITVGGALKTELPDALAAKPNLITVWLAANDFRAMESGTLTLAQYGQQLDQLLTALHSLTKTHIYVANLPQLNLLPYFKYGKVPLDTVAAQTLQWNVVINGEVAKYGDVLIDLYHTDLASHPGYIFADGFHPSTLGYQALTTTFWTAIQAHGGPNA